MCRTRCRLTGRRRRPGQCAEGARRICARMYRHPSGVPLCLQARAVRGLRAQWYATPTAVWRGLFPREDGHRASDAGRCEIAVPGMSWRTSVFLASGSSYCSTAGFSLWRRSGTPQVSTSVNLHAAHASFNKFRVQNRRV